MQYFLLKFPVVYIHVLLETYLVHFMIMYNIWVLYKTHLLSLLDKKKLIWICRIVKRKKKRVQTSRLVSDASLKSPAQYYLTQTVDVLHTYKPMYSCYNFIFLRMDGYSSYVEALFKPSHTNNTVHYNVENIRNDWNEKVSYMERRFTF